MLGELVRRFGTELSKIVPEFHNYQKIAECGKIKTIPKIINMIFMEFFESGKMTEDEYISIIRQWGPSYDETVLASSHKMDFWTTNKVK